MSDHHDLWIQIRVPGIAALQAPPDSSTGQRPGFPNRKITVRPERARGPRRRFGVARALGTVPGRCPGLVYSAPLARHCGSFLDRGK